MPQDKRPSLRIGVEEAARIIYGTPEPDALQVGQVRALIVRGVIQGSEDGRWTTAGAVAEYLAAAALRQRSAQRDERRAAAAEEDPPPQRPAWERKYRGAYRELLKDYFLALIYRRDRSRYSRKFQRAVIAGQVGLLALIIAVIVSIVVGVRGQPEPPELAAVRAWIEKDAKEYKIIRWYPPQPDAQGKGTSIRVIYEYSDAGRKKIHTDRVFIVAGGRVKSLSSHR
jgi:hypothetical protein